MKKNKITTALVALALLMSTGTNITSCTNEVDALDTTQGNSTAGKLGIVSLSSNGVSLAVRNAAQSRVTIDDGTTTLTPQPNRAISSFTAGDVVTTRYHFVNIANGTVPPASTYNGSATASDTEPLEWKMSDSNATNPLQPSEDKTGESWTEARMEISYAPAAETYEEELTASPDGTNPVRQYYDALVASSLSTHTSFLPSDPATLIAGQLYIDTNEKTLGAVTANLAHSGALMQLKADKTTISGFAEGFDCLTHLLARATINEVTGLGPTKTVYIRFSPVTLTDGSTVWQAIVPAGTVVSGFTATIGLLSEGNDPQTTATYHIALPTAAKAMAANTSYQLSLKLTPDVQTFAVSGAPTLPGWPTDSTEEKEWTNVVKDVEFIDTKPGQPDNVRTYIKVNSDKGLMEVIDYINGTNYSGKNKTKGMHLNTNVKLTEAIYDLSKVYKANANDTSKPDFLPIGSGTDANGNDAIYTGTFDGDSDNDNNIATIKGLYIGIAREYNGLFAQSTGTIKNIKLTGVNINITSNASDNALDEYIGGIVGYNGDQYDTPGSVTNCIVQVTINKQGYTISDNKVIYLGGVVGYSGAGGVTGCTVSGSVKYNSRNISCVGGIMGCNYASGYIVACISTATVSNTSNKADSATGGVIGSNDGKFCGCYSTGAVSGNGTNTYGVVYEYSTAGFSSSKGNYWVKPSSPASTAINSGKEAKAEKLNNITALNGKVTNLNTAITEWNADTGNAAMQCNYHFEAGSSSTPPTLVASKQP